VELVSQSVSQLYNHIPGFVTIDMPLTTSNTDPSLGLPSVRFATCVRQLLAPQILL